MDEFTYEELQELKKLACNAENFDLASKVLQFIRLKYPKEEAKKNREKRKALKFKRKVYSVIRAGGKDIDADFFKDLFVQ